MAKETKRQRQVAEMVKRHMSVVMQQEGSLIYGFEVLVTVTGVKMSSDLGLAKVYLSVFNGDSKEEVLAKVRSEDVRLRKLLAHRIRKHVRRIPNVDFYLDETIDEMYRVSDMFDRLHKEGQMGSEDEE